MPKTNSLQGILVALEQGRLGLIIKAAMFVALIVTLVLIYLFVQFKGLAHPTAMDQAQIARNLTEGKGFTTQTITPRAMATFESSGRLEFAEKPYQLESVPDIYHMPLVPWVNSFPLSFLRGNWEMEPGSGDLVYPGDRLLAFTAMILFLLGVAVWYFVIVKLFDHRLALLASAAVLLTDLLWRFSLSALPQMLLLLLFGGAILLTIYAERAQEQGKIITLSAFLAGAGLVFGLMILTHGLAVWIFAGWLLFCGFLFNPRGLMALLPLAAAAIAVVPWLVRNYAESGQPFGLAPLAALSSVDPYNGVLRLAEGGGNLSPLAALRAGVEAQGRNLAAFLGINVVALAFFVAIMHPFRNQVTATFRWGFLTMWAAAVLGMCFFRPGADVSENQIHVVFVPIFAAYGFAFLLVLWGRWEINHPLLRSLFVALVLFLCAIPLLARLSAGPQGRVQWPPYVPPFIAILGEWFDKDEMIASDMPYAVAWYANRHSLLLPKTVQIMNRIHDYRETSPVLQGLYLTPVSGDQKLYSQIYQGQFSSWARLITRPPIVANFPFPAFTQLPVAGQCIIFADRPRWLERRPDQE